MVLQGVWEAETGETPAAQGSARLTYTAEKHEVCFYQGRQPGAKPKIVL